MHTLSRSLVACAWMLGSTAAPLYAECNGTWDLTGNWQFNQSTGHTPEFSIVQDGATISGTGSYVEIGETATFKTLYNGTLSGSLTGNTFNFVADWAGDRRGSYQGIIDDAGNISGTTFDMNQPNSRAGWHANNRVVCIAAAPPTLTLGKRPSAQELATGAAAIGIQDSLILPGTAVVPTATALNDVDIYDGPDGSHAIIGMMASNSTANVLGETGNWYLLDLAVPGGRGWVAADHLTITR